MALTSDEQSYKAAMQKKYSGLDGLGNRAWQILRNARITNKDEALKAIESGILKPTGVKKIRGYGRKVHAEVCEWLGLPPPQKQPVRVYFEVCPHCNCKLY